MSNAPDITGQQFQRLTALWPIGRDRSRNHVWLFLCGWCGQFFPSRVSNVLTTGPAVVSCGCLQRERARFAAAISGAKRFKDLTGKRFGNLTVLEYLGRYAHPCGAMCHRYRCRCKCGQICERTARALKAKDYVQSCGCRRHQLRRATIERKVAA